MLIGVSGLAHRPRKLPRREAVDKWTVRAGARTGSLAVDNALRCPPHEPLPTCPQPATTTIKEPPSENSRSFFWKIQGLGFVANHFDVVPIRTNDESCIVIRVVVRAQTRRTIVYATRLQRRAIESLD